jgi:monooxygenase
MAAAAPGAASSTPLAHYDVIVIGAGLSGICAGYHLKKKCPNKTFLILEGRERIGGTTTTAAFTVVTSTRWLYYNIMNYSTRMISQFDVIMDMIANSLQSMHDVLIDDLLRHLYPTV